MYDMTLKELEDTIKCRKKGIAYEMWKQSLLITLGVADLLKDKKGKKIFPESPQEACPELFPPKPRLKININLNRNFKERS